MILMNQWEKLPPLHLPTHCKLVHRCLLLHKDDLLESDEGKNHSVSITKNFLPREDFLKRHISSPFAFLNLTICHYTVINTSISNKPSQIVWPSGLWRNRQSLRSCWDDSVSELWYISCLISGGKRSEKAARLECFRQVDRWREHVLSGRSE